MTNRFFTSFRMTREGFFNDPSRGELNERGIVRVKELMLDLFAEEAFEDFVEDS